MGFRGAPTSGDDVVPTFGPVPDQLHLDDVLVELGADLIRSGQTADEVERQLIEVGRTAGHDGFDVMALPTAIIVESSGADGLRSRLRAIREPPLRLDQVEAVDALTRRARLTPIDPDAAQQEIERIRAAAPPFSALVRAVGLGILATGFSLALQPTVNGMVTSFVLGTCVGLVLSLNLRGLAPVMPTLVTFVVAAVLLGFADIYGGENPIRYLIPPLVIFLPGATLTTGTIELAEGDMVSGSSRLVSGLVSLLLLATAIVAAGNLVNLPTRDLADRPVDQLGSWTILPAVVLIAIGYHLHLCAPRRTVPWILLVLTVAAAGQTVAAQFVTPPMAAFAGAALITPVVLTIDRRAAGPRATTLFLPGFYYLVPGASGLIDVTASVSPGVLGGGLTATLTTVVAIALGVLFATAAFRSATQLRST